MIAKLAKHHTLVWYGLGFLALYVLGACLSFIYYITKQEQKVVGHIYPYVYIDSVDVSGLTKQEALQRLIQKGYDASGLSLELLYKDDYIATYSASQLELAYNLEESVDRAYLHARVGRPTTQWRQKIASHFGRTVQNIPTAVTHNKRQLGEFLVTFQEKNSKKAQNALFSFDGGYVASFQTEADGNEVQISGVLEGFEQAARDTQNKSKLIRISLQDKILKPDITLAQSNNLGIEELIGSGESDYTHSIPSRAHNVKLATGKFNGVLVPPGQELSFNKIIGDISAKSGYQPAFVIQNGRTVLGDGGGVCQVSTTLFRAALNTGLPIVERHAHAYRVGYYENDSDPGFDATIFTPSVDLRIKNDTKAHILIQTNIDEANYKVYFNLYGKRDERKVLLSKANIGPPVAPGEPIYQDDPSIPKGQTKQVDFAAWGARVSFDYQVTYPNGKVEKETFYSSYRPWQAVYIRGTRE